MFGLRAPELIAILALAFILFGARKLPEMAKGVADGIKIFKKTMKEDDSDSKGTKEKEKTA